MHARASLPIGARPARDKCGPGARSLFSFSPLPLLSHRNLADVIGLATGREYHLAWSDVVDAMGTPDSDEVLTRLRQRLEPHGLTAWLADS